MKILHFIDSLGSGGKERRLIELLKGLEKEKNYSSELVLMSRKIHYREIYDLDVKIHFLIRKIKKDLKIVTKLFKLCKEIKPDIIHTWDSMTSIYTVPLKHLLGIKLINGMITDAPFKLKAFGKNWMRSKLTFPFSDAILSNSHAGLRAYKVPAKRSLCIHNGFDFSRLDLLEDKNTIREKFKIEDPKIIGMVANFTSNKDYQTYLEAAQKVLAKKKNITFLAIGDGPHYHQCKQWVKDSNRDKIKFLGQQNNVESIINVLDIGVLSTYTEGLSNSIMEYMALGKPVIATEGGGTDEIVLHEKTGFLIRPGYADTMTEKIEFLLDHKETALSMGKAGKARILKNFTLDKMVQSYIELYTHIIHSPLKNRRSNGQLTNCE